MLTLDLTRIPASGVFVLDDLIIREPERTETCDICLSPTVGAFRVCDGERMCGLCCASHKEKVRADVIERLKHEYAKPCVFCGLKEVRKHFDHINMFTKEGNIGFMVEDGCNSDDILKEIDKCQIACVACHHKVTAYERSKGFIRKKRRLNAKKRRGEDVSALTSELSSKYSAQMEPFYARLRARMGTLAVGGEVGIRRPVSIWEIVVVASILIWAL
jgi:hypothetical protein